MYFHFSWMILFTNKEVLKSYYITLTFQDREMFNHLAAAKNSAWQIKRKIVFLSCIAAAAYTTFDLLCNSSVAKCVHI